MKPMIMAGIGQGTSTPAIGNTPLERDQLKSAKIGVLKLINENRDLLFEKTTDQLTKEAKEAKWAEIADRAHELGAIPWHRTWDYLKDTTWQNWRKRFVEKREKKEKADRMDGAVRQKIFYDEADLIIMDILDSLGKSGPYHPPTTMSVSIDNSINSFSKPDASENGNGQIRDISDLLEIEFDIKSEDRIDDEDEDDVVDGPPGPQIEIHEEDEEGEDESLPGEFQNVYGNNSSESSLGFERRNSSQSYSHQQQSHYNNLSNNGQSNEGNEASASHPKIINATSLSSRASFLRKTAFGNIRKRSASCLTSPSQSNSSRASGSNFFLGGRANNLERELMELKCKKLQREVDLLQKESYKRDLEILQLERSLGLPASQYTRKFSKHPGSLNEFRR